MSVSLYRKYRPQNFNQVLDQDHIVKSLQSAIASGNISHAYLFAGSRGTGKTSIARIFAREIGTSPNDIYEIDAASNRGINEAKELIAGVTTLPFDSKYKVYILDEVHMLTKEAWNAFLKTLEEPPAHVVFILATTEMHKVPDTVRSRCQVFEFKKPAIETISKMLIVGAEKEGYEIEIGAAFIIARKSDGAFRDAWGLLEQVMQASSNKKITEQGIYKILSISNKELVSDFVVALVTGNIQKSLEIINLISKENQSLEHFTESVIQDLREVLLFRFAPSFAETISADKTPDARAVLVKLAKESNVINAQLLSDFLKVLDEMKKTTMPEIVLELAIMRILGNNATQKAL